MIAILRMQLHDENIKYGASNETWWCNGMMVHVSSTLIDFID